MTIEISPDSLVVLVGPSGAGKSTFARKHFPPTEIVSSDACRALVADDENAQEATVDAFALLHIIVRKRLRSGRLTVADATNVKPESRRPLLALARRYARPAFAVIFNLPQSVCLERNAHRGDRSIPADAIARQRDHLVRSLPLIDREGFAGVWLFDTEQAVETATVERSREPVLVRNDGSQDPAGVQLKLLD